MTNRSFVSVIIPVYNDEKGLRDTLMSLSKQCYPDDKWEVIVIDNNSSDGTFQVAQAFKSIIPSMQVAKENKQSSYAARNRGISIARGEVLAFIDSDMIVEADWIKVGVTDIKEGNADYVGCRVDLFSTGASPTIYEVYNQRLGFPIKMYMETHGFAGGGNIFVKKKVFNAVGEFNPLLKSGGDMEFGNRVRDAGYKMFYSDRNVMRHPSRSNLKSILMKSIRLAKGELDLKWFFPKRYGELRLFPILYLLRPPLKLIPFFYILKPPVIITANFMDLRKIDRIKILIIMYLLRYVRGITQLIYYFKLSICSPIGIFNSSE